MITAPQVVTGLPNTPILSPGYVSISGGEVTDVGQGPPPAPADVALPDGVLAPGFVDLQVNGYFGEELAAARPAGWARVVRGLPETGTTAFLPTFITAPLAGLTQALRAAAALMPGLPAGARVLGIHLEGPFISPARRGAHNEAWITDPTPPAIDELLGAAGGRLRLVTLAPERPGGLAAVARFLAAGVLVSVGHSDATAAQVAQAADAGARMVTHLFNAQRPLHHREPGVVGQALADPRLTSGLIGDLHHVSAQACLIAFAAAPQRIALVTDAAACAGMPPGRYLLGGQPIEVPAGAGQPIEVPAGAGQPIEMPAGAGQPIEVPAGAGQPPVRADGTLAGSALRMDSAVASMVSIGVGLADAVAAATRVPADLIGCPTLGRIAPGAAGDLAWLGPDLRARATWAGGRQVFGCAMTATVTEGGCGRGG